MTRMEALLADGIKQMQTKIDKDLGLDVHDAIDKARLQQLRERRKQFMQLRRQRESLENESARSDSPSF